MATTETIARYSREHNGANVLTLGATLWVFVILNIGISVPTSVANLGAYEALIAFGLREFHVPLDDSIAVAIVHAGWRGIAAGVLEAGVDAIRRLGGHGPIHAVAGPAAGACCYEVGPEVHEVFGHAHRHGRRIDLRAIAHDRLLAAGAARVLDVEACTICDERFFSHRREGPRAGRQVGVAWLS